LATALVSAEEFVAALAALRCALMLKKTSETTSLAVHCMKQLRHSGEASAVRDLVVQALADGWDRPGELALVSAALIKPNPAIGTCVEREVKAWPRRLPSEDLFGSSSTEAVGQDELLQCLLESTPVWDLALERFLTAVRCTVLERAMAEDSSTANADPAIGFYCALARQCFINEYVFARDDDELKNAEALRERLAAALAAGAAIPMLWPVAVAAYFPLNAVSGAERLLAYAASAAWPDAVAGVLAQQISEPVQERQLAPAIPRLTEIEDSVSVLVREQYEQNPFPRWVRTASGIQPMTVDHYFRKCFRSPLFADLGKSEVDILVAGCGTGRHPVESAQKFAGARVLAIDLSLASLAYAQRKTRAL